MKNSFEFFYNLNDKIETKAKLRFELLDKNGFAIQGDNKVNSYQNSLLTAEKFKEVYIEDEKQRLLVKDFTFDQEKY